MTETGLAGADQATTTTSAPTTVNVIGPDGTFSETWKDTLPEDLKNDASLKDFKRLDGLARAFRDTKKMVGANTIVRPTDASKPEDWEAFYEAGGRPKTPGDYTIEIPEQFKDYYDDDLLTEARGQFHKAGLNQKQAAAIINFYNRIVEQGNKDLQDQQKNDKLDAETALKEKWGIRYEEKLRLANRMIAENVADSEQQEAVLSIIGNNPLVADFLARIATKFLEHKEVISTTDSPQLAIEQQLKELQESEAYIGVTKQGMHVDPKLHQEAYERALRLRERLNRLRGLA